ncbi:hypothetical protein DL239_14460 [Sedimentitalea sp. CY04]|uniref:Uncharacterized protein n=1 Tax=Parasedimentitalea denitrificans TaxID=2211118 RepID=A0ABX0WBZ5_9RHOB|nr:hypothetical protein [Sedimentitalea sp. CY04]
MVLQGRELFLIFDVDYKFASYAQKVSLSQQMPWSKQSKGKRGRGKGVEKINAPLTRAADYLVSPMFSPHAYSLCHRAGKIGLDFQRGFCGAI